MTAPCQSPLGCSGLLGLPLPQPRVRCRSLALTKLAPPPGLSPHPKQEASPAWVLKQPWAERGEGHGLTQQGSCGLSRATLAGPVQIPLSWVPPCLKASLHPSALLPLPCDG